MPNQPEERGTGQHTSKTHLSRRLSLLSLLAFTLCASCKESGKQAVNVEPATKETASAPKLVKLGFVTNNASEFWKIAAAGVHKYEKEGKVQVDVKMPPNGTTDEQNQILENLASQGYDAIAVSAIAPDDQVPVLDKVAAKSKCNWRQPRCRRILGHPCQPHRNQHLRRFCGSSRGRWGLLCGVHRSDVAAGGCCL